MKKINFLVKLFKEGKLQVIEPSEETKEAYIKKSESYLYSAKILLDNNKVEESVSMTYYSMYYISLALFHKTGIKCENHSASIILLKELFNIDNSEMSSAKKERIDKQYYVDFFIVMEDALKLIRTAEMFNSRVIDYMERLTKIRITELRDELKESLRMGKRA